MTIKLLKDMDFVYGGDILKKGMIVETIEIPEEYKGKWGLWVQGKYEPIRLMLGEYEIIENEEE